MRPDAWVLGIAACLVAGTAEASNNEGLERRTANTVIQFQEWTSPTIFQSILSEAVINWNLGESNVTISSAFLKSYNDNSTLATGYLANGNGGPISTGTQEKRKNDGRSKAVVGPAERLAARRGVSFPINAPTDGPGSITLPIKSDSNDFSGVFNLVVYLELDWSSPATSSGQSYTPLFAVSDQQQSSKTYKDLLAELNRAYSAGGEESPYISENTNGNSAPTTVGGGTSSIVMTTGSPSTSVATETPGTAALGSGANSSSSKGLSTGAIAGIAVACGVVGIAIIGGLWFLCLRRRRNAHTALGQNAGGYASDGAAAMMADKELPHVSADSPRSTYASDRGQLSRDNPIGAGPEQRSSMVAAAATHEDTPYAPYSDRAPTSTGTRSQTDLAGATGTRSPTPPISTRYAHLIEEGMSEDEIRRLDEEERQLDAAIEVAGRNSRAA